MNLEVQINWTGSLKLCSSQQDQLTHPAALRARLMPVDIEISKVETDFGVPIFMTKHDQKSLLFLTRLILKMAALEMFETSVTIYHWTVCTVTKCFNIYQHRSADPKFKKFHQYLELNFFFVFLRIIFQYSLIISYI